MKKRILVSSILAVLVATGCTGKDAAPVKKAVEKKVEAKVEKKAKAKVVEAVGAPTVLESSIQSVVAPVAVAPKAITTSVASDATSLVVDKAVEIADDKTDGMASKVIETVR